MRVFRLVLAGATVVQFLFVMLAAGAWFRRILGVTHGNATLIPIFLVTGALASACWLAAKRGNAPTIALIFAALSVIALSVAWYASPDVAARIAADRVDEARRSVDGLREATPAREDVGRRIEWWSSELQAREAVEKAIAIRRHSSEAIALSRSSGVLGGLLAALGALLSAANLQRSRLVLTTGGLARRMGSLVGSDKG